MKGGMVMNCKINCCYQCQDRVVGCHSTCEKYKEQKKAWDKERAKERERKRQEYVRMKAIADAKERMTKGRKR